MKKTAVAESYIHLAEIEITYKCNLCCEHCYNKYERKKPDMKFDDIIKLIKEISKETIQKLIITGGEASVHKDFVKLCKYIKKNRKTHFSKVRHFVLQSNGNCGKFPIDLLKAFDIIHLSYDLKENELRNIDSSVIEQLAQNLNNEGLYTYLFCTLHKKNAEQVDEIIKRVNSKKLFIAFNFCISNCTMNPKFILSKAEKADLAKKLLKYETEKLIRPLKHPYMAVFRNKQTNGYCGNKGGCTAGIASFSVDTEGNMMPCPFLRVRCGNVFTNTVKNIWFNSPELALMRDRSRFQKCNSCEYISYCGGCRAVAYNKTNSLTGCDDECFLEFRN